MNLRMALAAVLVLGSSYPLTADQIRYDSARDWRQWNLPLGAVELTPSGLIQPTLIEKGTDAVRDLAEFGGGIRNAGSNLNIARLAIDGNPATGWAPDPEGPTRTSGLSRLTWAAQSRPKASLWYSTRRLRPLNFSTS